jgi:POT family proton-dependent oligopeptide transporter
LLLVFAIAVILFRIAYEQIGNSIALWTATGVDRDIRILGHFTVPMTWFQSLNPLFIFVLTPALLRWWKRQGDRGQEPRPLAKMSLGATLLALAFLLNAVATSVAGPEGTRTSCWVLVLFMLVLTAGELFFMPIGLSFVTRLAPPEHRATLLGGWFVLAFVANLIAGFLGAAFGSWSTPVFFATCACIALGSAVLLYIVRGLQHTPAR